MRVAIKLEVGSLDMGMGQFDIDSEDRGEFEAEFERKVLELVKKYDRVEREKDQAKSPSLTVERNIEQFEPGNPYRQDLYHMGSMVGSNIEVMYPCHSTERCKYLIIVNKETGERIRIDVK
jgi:hypothetical protein